MVHSARKVRLALDHNFPAPALKAFAVMMPNIELVPIAEVDPALAEVDDWELFVALHGHELRWDGLVTNDEALLSQPKERAVLAQTHLTLVVAAGEGHNPIRVVGVARRRAFGGACPGRVAGEAVCELGHMFSHSALAVHGATDSPARTTVVSPPPIPNSRSKQAVHRGSPDA